MSLILTQAGLAALAEAESTGTKVQATHMAVGDGDGATPEHTASSVALVNETWRGALQSITINEQGETEAGQQVIFEAHVPITVGGWYIRECALYADDVLLAIGQHPTLYKPAPEDPTKMEHIIKAVVTFGNADVVSLIVDPAVVLASQEHVATKVAEHNADDEAHADIRGAIDDMAEALANDTHAARTDNPHEVTAEQAGLGNLPNAKSDSVTSTSSDQLATSKAAKTAYDRGTSAITSLSTHVADAENPHEVTAEQVGAYTQAQVNALVAGVGDVLHVQDQKAASTSGGAFTAGAWQTRTLNTVVSNSISGASLSNNRITLPAGTYVVFAQAPAFHVNEHQTRLYNATNGTALLLGTVEFSNAGSNYASNPSVIMGVLTLTSTKVLEIQHQCTTSYSSEYAMGRPVAWGTCVYTQVLVHKVK